MYNTQTVRTQKNSKASTGVSLLYISPIIICINNFFLQPDVITVYVLIINLLVIFLLNLNQKPLPLEFFVCCFGVLVALINTYVNGSGFGSLVTYASLLFFVSFYSKIKLRREQISTIYRIAILSILIVLIVFSKRNPVNTYYYSILPQLTVERLNPNTVGIFYFFLYILLGLELGNIKNKNRRIFARLCLFAAVFYLIWKTHARTTIIALIVYVAANIIFRKKHTVKRRYSFLLCIVATLIFALLYCYLARISGSMTFMGKNLFSGRQVVWSEAFDIIKYNWLFGYDNRYAFYHGQFQSAHNTLLAVLFVFGIFPTLIFLYILDSSFKRLLKKDYDIHLIVALFCCIIIMTFETLLTDANTYYYFTLFFLGCGSSAKKVKNDDTQKNSLLLVRGKAAE